MFLGGFLSGMFLQLPGVVEVVPDTIEAADNGCHRSKERIAYPDYENGVFLADSLTGRNFVAIAPANFLSYPELENTAYQRNYNEPYLCVESDR